MKNIDVIIERHEDKNSKNFVRAYPGDKIDKSTPLSPNGEKCSIEFGEKNIDTNYDLILFVRSDFLRTTQTGLLNLQGAGYDVTSQKNLDKRILLLEPNPEVGFAKFQTLAPPMPKYKEPADDYVFGLMTKFFFDRKDKFDYNDPEGRPLVNMSRLARGLKGAIEGALEKAANMGYKKGLILVVTHLPVIDAYANLAIPENVRVDPSGDELKVTLNKFPGAFRMGDAIKGDVDINKPRSFTYYTAHLDIKGNKIDCGSIIQPSVYVASKLLSNMRYDDVDLFKKFESSLK